MSLSRAAALWVVLFAAYTATLGLPAFGESQFGGDEPHFLLIAESIVSDRDIDLNDEFAARAYLDWYPYLLERHGRLTDGHTHEPHGLGFALLIAPAYAIAGPLGVQLFMAAIAALAFVLAAALARWIVPEPWASGAALVCGLSAPALAYGTAVYPELAAGAMLTGAALLALRARERPRIRRVAGCALALAALPWLDLAFVIPGLVVALALLRWLRRRARSFAMLVATEILLFSGILYVTINDRLVGGFSPLSADVPGRALGGGSFPEDYVDRAPRLVGLWLDRSYGALRWAPVVALAFFALWLLWRSRRDHLAHALAERREVEVAATLCALVCAAQVGVAAFLAPTMFGFWFPGRYLLVAFPLAVGLCAWGLQRARRTGSALIALTLVTSVWMYAELRIDGGALIGPSSRAPLGPLDGALPLFGAGCTGATIAVAGVGVAVLLLVAREWRGRRALTRPGA
ncbi:MAG: hypothetical protein M3401_07125 [Actinomycetota bacterium]|nr:hypothetical protein [Actinomycetota bacterium]